MGKLIDVHGQKFGRLLVVGRGEPVYDSRHGRKAHATWRCMCDCGNECTVLGKSLRTGVTQSCGCFQKESTGMRSFKHGASHTPLWNLWSNMRDRCYNPNNKSYPYYGGRGITVCKEWDSFIAFRDWSIKSGYRKGLTIDRKNVNGNYEPLNCRWATRKEQGNNKRNNRVLTHNGKTMTMTQWADEAGMSVQTLSGRINERGWDVDRALTTPVNHNPRPAGDHA